MTQQIETKLANVASERAVLAGMMQFGVEGLAEIEDVVQEGAFTVDINKVLFNCMKHAIKKSNRIGFAEVLSAATDLSLHEFLNKEPNLKHIRAMGNLPIDLDNIREHAKSIKRLEMGRRFQEELRNIYTSLNEVTGSESMSGILSRVEVPIQNISLQFMRDEQNKPVELGNDLLDYLVHVEENPSDVLGIPTGFKEFDAAIGGGLRRKCVDLIGARPKTGKSVFCDGVAMNVSKMGIPVLVLDTEMSKEDHWNRMLAHESEIEINHIAKGEFREKEVEKEKVYQAAKTIEGLPFYYVSIAGKPFEETLSVIRRWVMKEVGYDENGRLNDCLIIYDYLKLMSSEGIGGNMQEYQILGFQITQLHNFCVEFDLPCLAFVQLNRDGIQREDAAAVSQSDRLVWLCTSFTIFKTKTEEEMATDGVAGGNRKLIPIVARHGPGLEGSYICMQMDGGIAKLTELGKIYEIKKRSGGSFEEGDSEVDESESNSEEYSFT